MLSPSRSFAAVAGLAVSLAGAPAADARTHDKDLRKRYLRLYDRVDRLGGDTGRNIVRHDVLREDGSRREATRRELRRSMGVLRRMEASLRGYRATVGAPAAVATTPAALQSIAACESGGDPTAVSADGNYRGKYQFDMQTWQSVGGTGDPAAAPEAEQDRRAQALMAQRGTSAWPTCG